MLGQTEDMSLLEYKTRLIELQGTIITLSLKGCVLSGSLLDLIVIFCGDFEHDTSY
jgi:hypothetical protein